MRITITLVDLSGIYSLPLLCESRSHPVASPPAHPPPPKEEFSGSATARLIAFAASCESPGSILHAGSCEMPLLWIRPKQQTHCHSPPPASHVYHGSGRLRLRWPVKQSQGRAHKVAQTESVGVCVGVCVRIGVRACVRAVGGDAHDWRS